MHFSNAFHLEGCAGSAGLGQMEAVAMTLVGGTGEEGAETSQKSPRTRVSQLNKAAEKW